MQHVPVVLGAACAAPRAIDVLTTRQAPLIFSPLPDVPVRPARGPAVDWLQEHSAPLQERQAASCSDRGHSPDLPAQAAYRRLALTILGLDVHSLASELSATRQPLVVARA
jgi:hypothetical protein